MDDNNETVEEDVPVPKPRKYRKVKRKVPEPEYSLSSFAFPGVVKLVLTEASQRSVKCVSGEDVTSENPWKFIEREAILDDIANNKEMSNFCQIQSKVKQFPNPSILVIYLPDDSEDEDNYYICLSIDAEERAQNLINKVKAEREERLNNTAVKTVRPWRTQGSAPEILDMIYKNNRPLIEVEVETSYPIKPTPSHFKLRLVEHAKDGYIEILSLRSTYTNVIRRKLDVGVQAVPSVIISSSQTIYPYPKHVITQYNYTYNVPKETREHVRNLKYFAHNTMNIFDDSIYVNGSIDFYTNDYKSLVKDKIAPERPQESHLKEFSAFYDHDMQKDKLISAISWHPMWTGVCAISYADKALGLYNKGKSDLDEVYRAMFELTPVHLWSIVDHLTPRLLLETQRDVSALSFCPYDENLLVGGCVNGQIVIWDITNRLQQAEQDEVLTAEQHANRNKMHSMMSWMRNTKDPRFVRLTVMSQLAYSPINAITAITWVSPFKEITKTGKITEIPKDENRTSLQFSTTSLDGTIQFWDLRGKLPVGAPFASRRYRHIKSRPAALTIDVSPLKPFHRVLKPIFKVNVCAPRTMRPLPLFVVGRQQPATTYVETQPKPNRKFDLNERIYFKPELNDNRDFENEYILGSVEGDFFKVTWEGYDYISNEIVSKETAKLHNFVKFHDGPLVSANMCPSFNNVVLTVGGKIFAVWLLEFTEKPIIWRKCSCRYTYGNWIIDRHSSLKLFRSDGYTESWNFTIRSDRNQSNLLRSGKWTFGSYAHPRPLEKQIFGLCDYTGAFRLFFTDKPAQSDEEEPFQLYQLLCREFDRKRGIARWNEQWNIKNPELLAIHKAWLVTADGKKREEKAVQAVEVINEVTNVKPREVLNADAEWRKKEVERMNALLLYKKRIDKEVLETQQVPLIKVREERLRKQEKLKMSLENASKLYKDAVTMMFADAVQERPPALPDPYKGGHYIHNKSMYFNSYTRIAQKYEQFVKNNAYEYSFNWFNMTKSGKQRRLLLEGYNERYSHKRRIVQDKVLREKVLIQKPDILVQQASASSLE